jgi:predicted lipid-binding transport protein (Tim44 family)
MDMSSGFPIDLVLFGMIAAFLVLRLRSVLGKRTGFERPAQPYQPPANRPGPVIDAHAEPAPVSQNRPLPEPESALGKSLARLRDLDRNFDPSAFLDGAEKAFRMIVTAFAAGDRGTLQGLLAPETYKAFEGAITSREQAGHVQVSQIRSIESSQIEAADLHGTIASVVVRMVTSQVSFLKDQAGQPVTGTDGVTEIVDVWTFERDLASHDPTWRLSAARSA